jgi:hypothetical protein
MAFISSSWCGVRIALTALWKSWLMGSVCTRCAHGASPEAPFAFCVGILFLSDLHTLPGR